MSRLRSVLLLNGASCVIFGLLFSLAPASVATFLADTGVAPEALIVALGVGLLINGLALFATARASMPNRRMVMFFSGGDALWVIGTLVLVATGTWIDRIPGIAAALSVALVVGAFGWLQWRALDPEARGVAP